MVTALRVSCPRRMRSIGSSRAPSSVSPVRPAKSMVTGARSKAFSMWGRRPTGWSACSRTYTPLPTRDTIRPSSRRIRRDCWMVMRATPYWVARSFCEGSFSRALNLCAMVAA